jgi:hypothetical protein
MLDSPFMRRSKSRRGLTGFSRTGISRTRGRRSLLSDAQLHNRRDQLAQIFEGYWGEIGWELQRCKKADDLIRIFVCIADPRSWVHDVVIPFCLPSPEAGSGSTVRKLRGERRALGEPIYTAEAAKRLAEEQLREVNSALAQVRGASRRILKRARRMRRKEYWKATQRYSDLSKRERELDLRLKGMEAGFARQELFRFLKSKRYVLTPLALANAAAGLPHMGWRHSVRRSTKDPCKIANGSSYQIFKAIRYLTAIAKKQTVQGFVGSFRERIPLLPSRYQLPKVELAGKWLYLERAIRQTYRRNSHLKVLAFEVTKRYFEQIKSQTQVDMVLAQQFKLALSKQPKRVTSSQLVKPDIAAEQHDKIMKAST